MTLREQLAAKKAALLALEDGVESGESAVIKKANEITEDIEELQARVDSAKRAQNMLAKIGRKEDEEDNGESEKRAARTLGENFVRAVKRADIRTKRFSVQAPEFKSNDTTQVGPTATDETLSAYAVTLDRNVVTAARTPLVIRDLFGAETIQGNALTYLVEGELEGKPTIVKEGEKKPQVHFKDPTPVTVSLSKIAAFIKESDEYISDYGFLASAINGRLLYELGLVEQTQLVSWLEEKIEQKDTYSAESATSIADTILQAAATIQQNSGFAADAAVMSPALWYTLQTGKDSDDRYYGGGYFGNQNTPNVFGIPVVVTSAVTGIIVGAFKTGASVVSKGGISVESTNSNEDDFTYNLMTIRAEERLALAIRRPACFVSLSAGTSTSSDSDDTSSEDEGSEDSESEETAGA